MNNNTAKLVLIHGLLMNIFVEGPIIIARNNVKTMIVFYPCNVTIDNQIIFEGNICNEIIHINSESP